MGTDNQNTHPRSLPEPDDEYDEQPLPAQFDPIDVTFGLLESVLPRASYIHPVKLHLLKEPKDIAQEGSNVVEYRPKKTGKPGVKEEGLMPRDKVIRELIERVDDRPDLAAACLQFLDTEVTKPQYAILSAEITKARLERKREQEREKKARWRAGRRRAAAPAEPSV